jgi:glutamyl/glutaminyl-tRNA synthetase
MLEELKKGAAEQKAFKEAAGYILALREGEPAGDIENALRDIAIKNSVKFGDLAKMIRIALTGRMESPGLPVLIRLLGEEAKKRLRS